MPVVDKIGRSARRVLMWPLVGWAVMAAVGYLPTHYLGGPSGLEAMIFAQAVVVTIVYTTLMPAMRRMIKANAKTRLQIALKTGVTRFVLTVLASAVIAWRSRLDQSAFLIWVAIAYVLMIKIETLTLIYWAKQIQSRQ